MTTPRDIGTALAELGVSVARTSEDEMWALCPQHEERTGKPDHKPSWSVNTSTGYHKCFSCGYGGTFVDLVLDLTDLNVFEVHRWIRRHGVRTLSREEMLALRYDQQVAETTETKEVEITEASLALFFRPPLWAVEERNLTMDSVERYDVLWDVLEQGWIIPVRLPDTTLIGWQFKSNRDFENYPKGMDKGQCLFGLELLEEGQTALVVESPLDCLRIYDAGIEPEEAVPVSTYGADVTAYQMNALLERTDSVIWAHDNDEAGMSSTQRVAMGVEKRGKVTARGWASRFRDFRVYNYYGSDRKDPGDQPDESIWFGIRNAQTPAALRMGRFKDWSKDDGAQPRERSRQGSGRSGRLLRQDTPATAARRANPLQPRDRGQRRRGGTRRAG